MTQGVEHLLGVGFTTREPPQPRATSKPVLPADEDARIRRATAGDSRALREIYDTHRDQVRAHLFRMLGPDCEIDDLTQVVFTRAFQALPRFERNATLSTWLYRITANTTHNLMRKRFRRERINAALARFHHAQGTASASPSVEARDEAQRVLSRLAPNLREVFVLYHYEGLTLQEIADILERPVSTIGDRLTRARTRIRTLVGGRA